VKTKICEQFGIEFPLFAFSHCRDVVAAVSNAGGFGVLGGVAFTPDQLEQELCWIDDHVNGKPYGVDIIVPAKFEGKGENLTAAQLADRIPEDHRSFIADLLAEHDIPIEETRIASSALSGDTGQDLLEVSLKHPIKLMANALGVPPDYMIAAGKERGIPVAALVGAKEHAIKQVHAGVDLIVAQGTEAGGHCGEVTTLVLIPEVLEAIADVPGGRDIPVLAAGGIVTGRQMAATVALGAAGAWTGSVWLTTEEAETAPHTKLKMVAASSRDTIRSAGRTGKPSRQLVSDWTNAWAPNPGGRAPAPVQPAASASLDGAGSLAGAGEGGGGRGIDAQGRHIALFGRSPPRPLVEAQARPAAPRCGAAVCPGRQRPPRQSVHRLHLWPLE
jgi:NAD(P)H-dependent flavin oxidoreductase YrpB (nitropropane dioxygenase family)